MLELREARDRSRVGLTKTKGDQYLVPAGEPRCAGLALRRRRPRRVRGRAEKVSRDWTTELFDSPLLKPTATEPSYTHRVLFGWVYNRNHTSSVLD